MIDNYDSFYNLVQYLREIGVKKQVIRMTNDAEIIKLAPSFIVISPGLSNSDEAGISVELIRDAYKTASPFLESAWVYNPWLKLLGRHSES